MSGVNTGGDLCSQYPLFAEGYNIICNIPSRVMFTLLVNLGHSFPSLRSPIEVVYIVTLLHTLSLSCLFMFLTLSHHVCYLLFFQLMILFFGNVLVKGMPLISLCHQNIVTVTDGSIWYTTRLDAVVPRNEHVTGIILFKID